MADLSPEARRRAADALLAYIGRRWVVCDHAQIIDPGGAVDAVVAALDETAAAQDARCVSCGGPLVRQGEEWRHLAMPGCGALIVPEGLA